MSELRKIIVRPGEELPGIRVVGFNGQVDPLHTPARRAPVLVDETGSLVRLIPRAGKAPPRGEEQLEVHVERGLKLDASGEFPGHGTRIDEPLPARWDHTVVILGEAERQAAPFLRDRAPADEPPAVTRLLEWLARGCTPPTPVGARVLGSLVVWYCSGLEAHALWQRIQEQARRELFHATARGRYEDMVKASWWLSRAAFTDDDLYLAAAGLKSGGASQAEAMLQAMLENPPRPAQLQRNLQNALQELRKCVEATSAHEKMTGEGRVLRDPVLAGSRDAVRRHGLIKVSA